MNRLLANIVDNPILVRELRRRMRGKALLYSIMTYIVLMTISTVLVLVVRSPSPTSDATVQMLQQMRQTGEGIYAWITGIQVLLVLIIAPTITAGLTTGEKERKTFEFLRVTTITRWMYIIGCFLSTAFYVALALICALPLISLSFLYGGVTLEQVIATFFMLLGGSLVLSSFGLFISSVCERTRTAQGIVVFLIFAMLFGGAILLSQLSRIFSGVNAAAGGSSGKYFIFGLGLQPWVVAFLFMVSVTVVLLLLSARKLFEPEEARAFAHWQFAVIFTTVIAAGLGVLTSTAYTVEIPEIAFLAIGFAMLVVAAHTFAVGRMEVGDEIWHLKRLFPLLRPLDQTAPYLIALGAAWYLIVRWIPSVAAGAKLSSDFYSVFSLLSVATFAVLCTWGRFATAITQSRPTAGRMMAACSLVLLMAMPVIGWIAKLLVPDIPVVGRELVGFSPFALLLDALSNPTEYRSGYIPGTVVAVLYAGAAVFLLVFGEYKRFIRWRHFDYHYDMPSR